MVIAQDHSARDKRVAFVTSVVFHGLLLLLFILWKIITPIPPFPEAGGGGGGLSIDLGTDMGGPYINPNPYVPPTQPQPTPEDRSEEVLTSDEEETTTVPEQVKPKPKPTPKPETPKPVTPKPVEPQPPKPNPNAIFTPSGGGGNSNSGGGSGSSSGGNGGPGDGGGDGGGSGGGIGSFHGKGFEGRLDGRGLSRTPSFRNDNTESGKVAVDIRVNPSGKVVYAKGRLDRPTTTTSPQLHRLAEGYAKDFTFTAKSGATTDQAGFIVFEFILQ